MELQDLDKLIIEMGMLGDKCREWRKALENIKDEGGIKRYDIDTIVLMGELLKFDTRSLLQTIATTTGNFMGNRDDKCDSGSR